MLDFGYYNMDCMEGMKEFPDKYFDLAIVDPPYGIGEHGGVNILSNFHAIEWAEIVGINAHCLLHRKELGWTIEEILTIPLRGKRNVYKLQKGICSTE